MGPVFEDYVSRLLARVYPSLANRYLGPKELEGAISGKKCDFVLLYGDALVLLEAKATRFSLPARTEESWTEYEGQFNEIFLDSASQIDNTVKAIEAGKLLHLQIDPAVIRVYFPLLVTLEDLPMSRPIYRKVREDIEKEGLLQDPKVRPFQAIDIGNLEFLEIGMDSGRSLREILQEKVASDETRDQSMGNYLLSKDEPFIKGPASASAGGPVNNYLADLFTKLGDRALDVFRASKRPTQQEQPSRGRPEVTVG
jgi:hypothetical protein